ncbi:MAG: prolyl oligopeptidase family serine peptidase [Spirochaetaceae bacterium]|jgi:acetyl esterase/lipase|nr:prolyl oligopeptidase family serine peptidase [Spirochaetaceae bacterium]
MLHSSTDAAFIGSSFVKGKIRAVVTHFHGSGWVGDKTTMDVDELELAYNGGLMVFPFYGPWAYMNRKARTLIGETIDLVYQEHGLDDSVPLIITGHSMGGQGALIYARYSGRKPAAVVAKWPLTDLRHTLDENAEWKRTLINAYINDYDTMDEAIAENSPLEQVENMPRVPYFVIHGDADQVVAKSTHSDRFVERMREAGYDIEYIEAPGMVHSFYNDFSHYRRMMDFTLKFFKQE